MVKTATDSKGSSHHMAYFTSRQDLATRDTTHLPHSTPKQTHQLLFEAISLFILLAAVCFLVVKASGNDSLVAQPMMPASPTPAQTSIPPSTAQPTLPNYPVTLATALSQRELDQRKAEVAAELGPE